LTAVLDGAYEDQAAALVAATGAAGVLQVEAGATGTAVLEVQSAQVEAVSLKPKLASIL